VVEGRVGRQLSAVGMRLMQVVSSGGPVRALLALRSQRAVLAGLVRELDRLPGGRPPVPVEIPAPPARQVSEETAHAERVTVGAALLSPAAAARVGRWLRSEDFSSPDAAAVFTVVVEMRAASRPVDRVTVAAELRTRGLGVPAGFVADCEAAVPVAASAGFYARQVLADSVARQVGMVGWQVTQLGESGRGDAVSSVHAAAGLLDGLAPLASRLRMFATPTVRSTAPLSPARRGALEPARW
jgi:hypothetical protein